MIHFSVRAKAFVFSRKGSRGGFSPPAFSFPPTAPSCPAPRALFTAHTIQMKTNQNSVEKADQGFKRKHPTSLFPVIPHASVINSWGRGENQPDETETHPEGATRQPASRRKVMLLPDLE